MNLKELCGLMGNFAHGVFATIDENGYPDMRGWEFQFEKDGKLYFTTSSVKSVYRQMLANPRVAYMCDAGDYHIRISGDAVMVEDPAEKEAIYRIMDPSLYGLYPTVDADGFTVFYIEHGTAKFAKGYDPFESFQF